MSEDHHNLCVVTRRTKTGNFVPAKHFRRYLRKFLTLVPASCIQKSSQALNPAAPILRVNGRIADWNFPVTPFVTAERLGLEPKHAVAFD
jgi:hypothetical protein